MVVETLGHTKALLSLLRSNGSIGAVAMHFHNTYGQALANILQSLQVYSVVKIHPL